MNTKNKGGRPPIESFKKKKNQVVCYLDEVEFLLLEKRINSTRQKKSEILKNALIKELNSEYKEPRKYTHQETHFLREISRIGNNLNQIATKLNSGIKLIGLDSVNVISSINELQKNIVEIKQKI